MFLEIFGVIIIQPKKGEYPREFYLVKYNSYICYNVYVWVLEILVDEILFKLFFCDCGI